MRARASVIGASLLVAAGVASGAVGGDAARPRFVAGVARADGTIVPFGAYRAGSWTPGPSSAEPDEPAALSGTTAAWLGPFDAGLERWVVWAPGDVRRVVTASKLVRARCHCVEDWALQIGEPEAGLSPHESPGVRGLALTADLDVTTFTAIPGVDARRARVTELVRETFDRLERDALDRRRRGLGIGTAGGAVPDLDPVVEPFAVRTMAHSARAGGDGEIVFVEASRSYRAPAGRADGGCEDVSFLSAWLVVDAEGAVRLLDVKLQGTGCDLKDAATTVPLGAVALDGHLVVFVVENGYEGESYAVLELDTDAVRAVHRVYAGGC